MREWLGSPSAVALVLGAGSAVVVASLVPLLRRVGRGALKVWSILAMASVQAGSLFAMAIVRDRLRLDEQARERFEDVYVASLLSVLVPAMVWLVRKRDP